MSRNGCWDLTPAPVLLAGSDGNIHETRPTASLARDLAQSDAQEAAEVLPLAAKQLRRRSHPKPDERPLQGAAVSWQVDMSDTVKRSPGSAGKTSFADRPIGAFGSAAGPSSPFSPSSGSTFPRRHTYGGGGPSSPSRHKSGGGVAPSRGTRQRVSAPGAAAARQSHTNGDAVTQPQQRRTLKSYNPINELLEMGFDSSSARVAIAAAGGDVDLAVRIMLEDLRAHNARTQCEWEFEGDAGWAPFDVEADSTIKQAVARGDDCCEVRIAGHRYLLDFSNLTQFNLHSRRTRRIRRRSSIANT